MVDTKQTKMILGHKAHLFRFSLKDPRFTRTGYAWIAADIAAPSQSESFVPVIVDAFSLSHQFPEMLSHFTVNACTRMDIAYLFLKNQRENNFIIET